MSEALAPTSARSFGSSTVWIAAEFVIAVTISFIIVVAFGGLSEQSMASAVVVSAIVLFVGELGRQFPEYTDRLTHHVTLRLTYVAADAALTSADRLSMLLKELSDDSERRTALITAQLSKLQAQNAELRAQLEVVAREVQRTRGELRDGTANVPPPDTRVENILWRIAGQAPEDSAIAVARRWTAVVETLSRDLERLDAERRAANVEKDVVLDLIGTWAMHEPSTKTFVRRLTDWRWHRRSLHRDLVLIFETKYPNVSIADLREEFARAERDPVLFRLLVDQLVRRLRSTTPWQP